MEREGDRDGVKEGEGTAGSGGWESGESEEEEGRDSGGGAREDREGEGSRQGREEDEQEPPERLQQGQDEDGRPERKGARESGTERNP